MFLHGVGDPGTSTRSPTTTKHKELNTSWSTHVRDTNRGPDIILGLSTHGRDRSEYETSTPVSSCTSSPFLSSTPRVRPTPKYAPLVPPWGLFPCVRTSFTPHLTRRPSRQVPRHPVSGPHMSGLSFPSTGTLRRSPPPLTPP